MCKNFYNLIISKKKKKIIRKNETNFKKWKITEEDIWMTDKHMKRCSTALVIREMQIKTTMTYHCTHIRIAKIKMTNIK